MSSKAARCALLTFLVCRLAVATAFAGVVDLGRHGNVYDIAEPDFMEEVAERARALEKDSEAFKRRMRERIESYRPYNAVSLPPAKKNKTRLVDMTWTLEFDITDGRGNVIYPKGFQFNPLEYAPFNETLVVLNGEREEELRWFLSSEYAEKSGVKVLLTEGRWGEAKKRLGRHVWYLTDFMAGRLRLEATPSVVTAEGNRYMRIREFHVKGQGGDRK